MGYQIKSYQHCNSESFNSNWFSLSCRNSVEVSRQCCLCRLSSTPLPGIQW